MALLLKFGCHYSFLFIYCNFDLNKLALHATYVCMFDCYICHR